MKKIYIFIISVLLHTLSGYAQTTDQNYIRKRTMYGTGSTEYTEEINYLDGLGRPGQTIMKAFTPLGKDLTVFTEYDSYGRVEKEWLPAVTGVATGAFQTVASLQTKSKSTNADDSPYSSYIYEQSPLNRVLKENGPGKVWYTAGRGITHSYTTNSATDAKTSAYMLKGMANQVSKTGTYPAGTLSIKIVVNEDQSEFYEFTDKEGRVILTRQFGGVEVFSTYYVYDDYGNLTHVLPPLLSDILASKSVIGNNDTEMKQYGYLYTYDSRKRMIAKKLPGVEPVYFVYDRADRLIFQQDGEMRTKNEWFFTLPDTFGRIVVSGICKNEFAYANNPLKETLVDAVFKGETNIYKGYTCEYTLKSPQVLAVYYYDQYEFLKYNGFPKSFGVDSLAGYTSVSTDICKGFLTGQIDVAIEDGTLLHSVVYYSRRGWPAFTRSKNHLDGEDKEFVSYSFDGLPEKRYLSHTANSATTTEEYFYTYDHGRRLTRISHKLDGGTEMVLAANTYDELGRLVSSTSAGNASLKRTYGYNVRSWFTSIESTPFKEKLYYNTSFKNNVLQYGGNITAQSWQITGDTERTYTYKYDNLSRLVDATYNASATGRYNTSYSYDKHGNIRSLIRRGRTSGTTPADAILNDFTMTYSGNQLTRILDMGVHAKNGSAKETKDMCDEVLQTTYNLLNLPRRIDIKNSVSEARLEYTYSSSGGKLRVKRMWNPSHNASSVIGSGVDESKLTKSKVTDYIANKIYEDGQLKRVLVEGGYYDVNTKKYCFYLKDHQGNNRVVLDQSGTILQKTHYYPFGMSFAESAGEGTQPYKYNGKELESDYGLTLYDYHARQYDPVVGQFTSMDPLAEKYYSISPYAYVANNPVNAIDPTGMVIDSLWMNEWQNRKQEILSTLNNLARNNKNNKNDERIGSLQQTLSNMKTIEKSVDEYTLSPIRGGEGAFKYDPSTKKLVIEYFSTGNFVHEVTHAAQYERGDIGFDINTGGAIANDIWNEVEAYKSEYNFSPASFSLQSASEINPDWVRGLKNFQGYAIYAPGGFAHTGQSTLNKNSGASDLMRAYPHIHPGIYLPLLPYRLGDFSNFKFK